MTKPAKRDMTGWGHYPVINGFVYEPDSIANMQKLLQEVEEPQIAYGRGRSCGDAALNEDAGMIRTTQLQHLLAFDEPSGILTCEAGVTLADIIDVFLPRGYMPAVIPGTAVITVGGAIANDVHGMNHHQDGSFADYVDQFDLLLASEEIITCSREENPDAFWATIGGMGLTGIIVRVTLRLMPVATAGMHVTYAKTADLTDTLDNVMTEANNDHYADAWIDCLRKGDAFGRAVLMQGEHATTKEWQPKKRDVLTLPKPALRTQVYASLVQTRWFSKTAEKSYYRSQQQETKLLDLASFFYPRDAAKRQRSGTKRFMQYQAVFPNAYYPEEGVRRLLEKLTAFKDTPAQAELKRLGPASGGLLSFPVAGYELIFHLPVRQDNDLTSFLRELDEIVLAHRGRISLGSDARLDADTFRKMYPSWERFMDVKHELDPKGLFSSSMARRLALDVHFNAARWF